jgi:hypothetical protein
MVSSSTIANNQLARIWTQATPADRAALSLASNTIDRELREDAEQKGLRVSSATSHRRQLEISPLRVYFDVSEPDRRVRIVGFELVP